jgi:hypothetical protein
VYVVVFVRLWEERSRCHVFITKRNVRVIAATANGFILFGLCAPATVTRDDRSGQTAMITLAGNSALDVMCMFLCSTIMFPWHPKAAWLVLYALLNLAWSPESPDTQGRFRNGF